MKKIVFVIGLVACSLFANNELVRKNKLLRMQWIHRSEKIDGDSLVVLYGEPYKKGDSTFVKDYIGGYDKRVAWYYRLSSDLDIHVYFVNDVVNGAKVQLTFHREPTRL